MAAGGEDTPSAVVTVTFTRNRHLTHPTDMRLWDQTVGPPHAGHGCGDGGLQHAHPHSTTRWQYQNFRRRPVVLTFTAPTASHFGQSIDFVTRGRGFG